MRKFTTRPFEVHLMTTDPLNWVEPFVEAGADSFIFFLDAGGDPAEVIRAVKASGKQVGISLRIDEPLEAMAPYWEQLDTLCVIGTAIGIKGAGLDDSVPGKIRQARGTIDGRQYQTEIEADGGIRRHTVPLLHQAGADYIVPGSLMFGEDPVAMRAWLGSL
jgi:ribulose-phosphate 3-epimerase